MALIEGGAAGQYLIGRKFLLAFRAASRMPRKNNVRDGSKLLVLAMMRSPLCRLNFPEADIAGPNSQSLSDRCRATN